MLRLPFAGLDSWRATQKSRRGGMTMAEYIEKIVWHEVTTRKVTDEEKAETVGARFAESLRGWRNRKMKKAI